MIFRLKGRGAATTNERQVFTLFTFMRLKFIIYLKRLDSKDHSINRINCFHSLI